MAIHFFIFILLSVFDYSRPARDALRDEAGMDVSSHKKEVYL